MVMGGLFALLGGICVLLREFASDLGVIAMIVGGIAIAIGKWWRDTAAKGQ